MIFGQTTPLSDAHMNAACARLSALRERFSAKLRRSRNGSDSLTGHCARPPPEAWILAKPCFGGCYT